jgi:outer membrane protein insertion porin family
MTKFLFLLLFTVSLFTQVKAQVGNDDTTKPTAYDPVFADVLDGVPKEYTITKITTKGNRTFDSDLLLSISGLAIGDKVVLPGGDALAKAIYKLWEQKYFEDININLVGVKIKEKEIALEIAVTERARLLTYKLLNVRRTERDDLDERLNLNRNRVVTENLKRNAIEQIDKYFKEKSYARVRIKVTETVPEGQANYRNLIFEIEKGVKTKINFVNIAGNNGVPEDELKKRMKGTKERMRVSFYADKPTSVYENIPPRMKGGDFWRKLGFLNLKRTRQFIAPWVRLKLFGNAKYNPKKLEEDKEKIIDYYNAQGYRDAVIEKDTVYFKENGVQVEVKVNEGNRYYFGNITFSGNTKYPDSVLRQVLGIKKGDIYNISTLNSRLGKEQSADGGGGDIGSLYQDDGYLFFRVEPIETAVYNDTIDFDIHLTEGLQARYKNIIIIGNDKTKEYVIRREMRTTPGEIFSRSDLIRTQRELTALNFFNNETIGINPRPNPEDGTVDIEYKLEEKSSDQLELSAGFGGGFGLTGTLGVSFNNFSLKNIFRKSSWDPLPAGDGQKLSFRVQSSGKVFQSYNFSFTEPWLGGKKRNALTLSAFHSRNRTGGQLDGNNRFVFGSDQYLRTTGVSVGLAKQLRWPDDFFNFSTSLNFTRYKLKDFQGIFRDYSNGTSSNINLRIGLQRNSINNPTFPSQGNNFLLSGQFTLPYTAMGIKSKANNQYALPEYHKWRFNAEWYVPLSRGMGADKNRQFVLKIAAKYGFLGKYSQNALLSPFERFQVGDAGLNNQQTGLLGFDIIAHRGYPVYYNSNPRVNPENAQNTDQLFSIFNKYTMELRYPFSLNPTSTIYALTFLEASNGWYDFKTYNPFQLRRSVGVGMRFFLPMFGLLGFDYGIGLDRVTPGSGIKGAAKFTFMLGFEPE